MMLRVVAIVLAVTLSIATCEAAELRIFAALALQDALDRIGTSFSGETGHTADIVYGTVGALRRKLAAHERADVVVLTSDALDELAQAGTVTPDSAVPVAVTRIGVAVRAGAAVPDIATLDKFRAALLAARSVAYTDPNSGGAFGSYFAAALDRIGIAQVVNAKAVLRRGSHEVAASVANGEAELGVTFISAIVSTPGAAVAGGLPAPLEGVERFSAGVVAGGASHAAAAAFVRALGGAGAIWTSAGFEAAAPRR